MSQLKAVILMLTCFFILCNGQTTSLINVDDNDPRVQYFSPGPSNWIASTTSSSSLFQNTDHYTNVTGATVSFIFPGPMIQYWGNTDPSHGSCAIAIDGEYAETISSNGPGGAPPTLLFQRDDLDLQANHTIIITVASSTYPNICELDRFVYSTVISPTSTMLSSTTPKSTSQPASSMSSSHDSHKTLTIALAAGIGGGVVLLGLIIVSVCFLRRRKHRQPAFAPENPGVQSLPASGPVVVNELNASPKYPHLKSVTSHEDGLNSGTETSEMGFSDGGWHFVERPRTPDALPPSISSRYNMFTSVTPSPLAFTEPQPTTSPNPRFVRSHRLSQASVADRPLSRLSDREVDRIAESLATKFQPPSRTGHSPSIAGTEPPRRSSVSGATSDKRTSWGRPSYDSHT